LNIVSESLNTENSVIRNKLKFKKATEKIRKANILFICCAVLPTIISIGYFGFVASDVYVSESKFLIRSPDRTSTSSLGALLTGAGFSRSQDDSYTVEDYITSRDALGVLDKKLHIESAYSQSDIDCISRFSCLNFDKSFESLYRYYQDKVTAKLDTSSSIITLNTRAYTAENTYKINELLLEMSENLVNQLNARARQDMIKFASDEVASAEKKAKAAAITLASYRDQQGVIDPERQSTIQLQQVSKLQEDLLESIAALNQIKSVAKSNPQIPTLTNRILTLQNQIDVENNKVAGGKVSLAGKAAEYQRLSLERDFADKQLAVALTALEQAHTDAQRKQLYIERIAQPSKPDKAIEPRRLRNVLSTLVVGLILWGVLTVLIAGIKEHRA